MKKQKTEQELTFQELSEGQKKAFHRYFVDNDEALVSSLGNKYIENFIANGTLENGFSVISNKRVYFRGSCFTGNGKRFIKSDEERVVDLKDITGSGFIYQREIGILIGIVFLILVFFAGIGLTVTSWSSSGFGYSSSDLKYAQQQLKEKQSALEVAKKEAPAEEMEAANKIIADYNDNSERSNEWYRWYEGYGEHDAQEGSREFYLGIINSRYYDELHRLLFEVAFPADEAFSTANISNYDAVIARLPEVAEFFGKDSPVDDLGSWMESVFYSEGDLYIGGWYVDDAARSRAFYTFEQMYFSCLKQRGRNITNGMTNGEFAEDIAKWMTEAKAEIVSLFALSKPADYEQAYQDAVQLVAQYEETLKGIEALEAEVTKATNKIPYIKNRIAESRTTNLMYTAGVGILSAGAVSLILLFVNYLRRRRTFFEINYAGGKIAFNVSLYPKTEIDDFQKQLRRAKDLIQPQPVVATVTASAPEVVPASTPTNTKADELEKYATLLEKGLITKEEFDTLKKKAID